MLNCSILDSWNPEQKNRPTLNLNPQAPSLSSRNLTEFGVFFLFFFLDHSSRSRCNRADLWLRIVKSSPTPVPVTCSAFSCCMQVAFRMQHPAQSPGTELTRSRYSRPRPARPSGSPTTLLICIVCTQWPSHRRDTVPVLIDDILGPTRQQRHRQRQYIYDLAATRTVRLPQGSARHIFQLPPALARSS